MVENDIYNKLTKFNESIDGLVQSRKVIKYNKHHTISIKNGNFKNFKEFVS